MKLLQSQTSPSWSARMITSKSVSDFYTTRMKICVSQGPQSDKTSNGQHMIHLHPMLDTYLRSLAGLHCPLLLDKRYSYLNPFQKKEAVRLSDLHDALRNCMPNLVRISFAEYSQQRVICTHIINACASYSPKP